VAWVGTAMSLLASETQNKVAACRAALVAVEKHLDPLLARSSMEVSRKLEPLQNAELQVGLAYAVASLYFCHLLTQGIDPADHPIRQELDRIQLYFKKVRSTTEEVATREAEKSRSRVDAEVAKRIVQHYTRAAEEAGQRQREVAASMEGGPRPRPSACDEVVPSPHKRRRTLQPPAGQSPAGQSPAGMVVVTAGGESDGVLSRQATAPETPTLAAASLAMTPPQLPPPTLHVSTAKVPEMPAVAEALPAVGVVAAAVAPPAQPLVPPEPNDSIQAATVVRKAMVARRRPAKAKAPAWSLSMSTTGGNESPAELVPMDPTGEGAQETAASLVALGRADAERVAVRQRRRAERKRLAARGGTVPQGTTMSMPPPGVAVVTDGEQEDMVAQVVAEHKAAEQRIDQAEETAPSMTSGKECSVT